MDKCIATYEKKYKLKLTKPVTVEVYPNHEDFAVRALGMPRHGPLSGVTFYGEEFRRPPSPWIARRAGGLEISIGASHPVAMR
ncbi:MAG: hypothetical protein WDO73_15655 [Ignavibacteriota bacterium]